MNEKVFEAVVGSHNYNLVTPTSDIDRKLFVYPTFDDLYKSDKSSKSKTSNTEDVEIHDIRKLPQMLWKSNVNFIEVLFSEASVTYNFAPGAQNLTHNLLRMREDIASMNLPYLFDACYGMFLRKKKDFDRDKIFVLPDELDKARAGLKHAHSAIRIADFINRYLENAWDDFKGAIWYEESDPMRATLMELKLGTFDGSPAGLIEEAEQKFKAAEEFYKNQRKNEELNQWLQDFVRDAVKLNIKNELEEK
jgi:RNA repair pathway DNA polymerase beta family